MLLPAFTWKQMQVCVSEIRNLLVQDIYLQMSNLKIGFNQKPDFLPRAHRLTHYHLLELP